MGINSFYQFVVITIFYVECNDLNTPGFSENFAKYLCKALVMEHFLSKVKDLTLHKKLTFLMRISSFFVQCESF